MEIGSIGKLRLGPGYIRVRILSKIPKGRMKYLKYNFLCCDLFTRSEPVWV